MGDTGIFRNEIEIDPPTDSNTCPPVQFTTFETIKKARRRDNRSAGGMNARTNKIIKIWFHKNDKLADQVTELINRIAAGDVPPVASYVNVVVLVTVIDTPTSLYPASSTPVIVTISPVDDIVEDGTVLEDIDISINTAITISRGKRAVFLVYFFLV